MFDQELAKLAYTIPVPVSLECALAEPLLSKLSDRIVCRVCDAQVKEVSCHDDASAALAGVAVDEDFLVLLDGVVFHPLTDHEDVLGVGCAEVLPVVVVIGDPVVVKVLRIIAEADHVVDAVATRRMLTRLLQVENGANVEATTSHFE